MGKKNVGVNEVSPIGSYALKIKFDDGHDSGLYTWEYLHNLGEHQDELWRAYLERLAAAGKEQGVACRVENTRAIKSTRLEFNLRSLSDSGANNEF